jgi:hypothetical protein
MPDWVKVQAEVASKSVATTANMAKLRRFTKKPPYGFI